MTAVSAPARSAVSEAPPHHPPTRLGPLYRLWDGLGTLLANALLWAILAAYLLPMVYMFVTSIKEDAQLQSAMAPLWPARTVKYEYEGETVLVYEVPFPEGTRTPRDDVDLRLKGRDVQPLRLRLLDVRDDRPASVL